VDKISRKYVIVTLFVTVLITIMPYLECFLQHRRKKKAAARGQKVNGDVSAFEANF